LGASLEWSPDFLYFLIDHVYALFLHHNRRDDMTKQIFLPGLGIFFIGILFLVSCAPAATTVGTTPTLPPTNTAPSVQESTATPIPEVAIGVVVVDLLNIREGPGTNYPIVGSLRKDEKFYILGEVVNNTNNKWLLIAPSENSFGWVIGDQTYVTEQKEVVDLSTYLIWQKNVEIAKAILIALTPTPQ
jgi:uncharacterized protein YgiM (DUF1202 family)